ncbi:hypothetical protein NMG60_11026125 [Bertholletia excelsa]
MAYMITKDHPSLSHDKDEIILSDGGDKGGGAEATSKSVSSCLYLKSSSRDPQPLDREAVLRRLRHHKCVTKLRNKLEAMLGVPGSDSGSSSEQALRQRWLELDDGFCFP